MSRKGVVLVAVVLFLLVVPKFLGSTWQEMIFSNTESK